MRKLELPTFIGTHWDRHHNPTAWVGIREARGGQLTAAISHEIDFDRRLVLRELSRLFHAAGGADAITLGAVLAFPARGRPTAHPAPKSVSLKLRGPDEEQQLEAAE